MKGATPSNATRSGMLDHVQHPALRRVSESNQFDRLENLLLGELGGKSAWPAAAGAVIVRASPFALSDGVIRIDPAVGCRHIERP